MKKFNFFSVLLVALFMVCGFASNAQSYKTPADALAAVQSVIDNSQTTLDASTAVQVSPSNDLSQMVLRISLSEELMPKIKLSNNVAKSIQDLYDKYTNALPSTKPMRDAIDHIKNQVII